MAVKILKSKDIKDRKPHLKLCPNHYHYLSPPKRIYSPQVSGPAKRDGRGWYK
jgi:hypothetical protein